MKGPFLFGAALFAVQLAILALLGLLGLARL
jgi:hypothetical protein